MAILCFIGLQSPSQECPHGFTHQLFIPSGLRLDFFSKKIIEPDSVRFILSHISTLDDSAPTPCGSPVRSAASDRPAEGLSPLVCPGTEEPAGGAFPATTTP